MRERERELEGERGGEVGWAKANGMSDPYYTQAGEGGKEGRGESERETSD